MTPAPIVGPPVALTEAHLVSAFDSGEHTLDRWIARHAMANQVSGASRSFVLCREDRVIAYYALAAGAIASNEAPGRLRRNMPDPIPVFILGRLAVARAEQGRQLGALMLRDAVLRTFEAAKLGGIAGIVVHAISDRAKEFYLHHGFVEAPSHPLTLIARLKDLGFMEA